MKKICFLFAFITTQLLGFAQTPTDFKITLADYSINPTISWLVLAEPAYSIQHSPTNEDVLTCEKYHRLLETGPNEKNHRDYFKLACALWETGKLEQAEAAFLTIVGSKNSCYTSTYHHSSDIPGDTTTNIYGYGSFTSHYKNYACRYLAKIYIEWRQFGKALGYLHQATNQYRVGFSCGTGANMYNAQIEGLYELAYNGIGTGATIYQLLFPLFPEQRQRSFSYLVQQLDKRMEQCSIFERLKQPFALLESFRDAAFDYESPSPGL